MSLTSTLPLRGNVCFSQEQAADLTGHILLNRFSCFHCSEYATALPIRTFIVADVMTLHLSRRQSNIFTISSHYWRQRHIFVQANRSAGIYIFRWNERYQRLWTYDINKQSIFGSLPAQIILSVALKQDLTVRVKGTVWQTYKVQCSRCKTSMSDICLWEKQRNISAPLLALHLCCYWASTAVLLGTNEAPFNTHCEWHSSGTLITRTWDAIDLRAVDNLANFFFLFVCLSSVFCTWGVISNAEFELCWLSGINALKSLPPRCRHLFSEMTFSGVEALIPSMKL